MHGWISLPATWLLILLTLAPILGLTIGIRGANARQQIALWLGYVLVYSLFVVLVAFVYEAHGYGGHYNMRAWGVLVVPVFLFALPAMGLPWLLGRSFARSRNLRGESPDSSVSSMLLVAGAIVLLAVVKVVLENTSLPIPRSTYVIPPIDPARGPADFSEVTNGSDWSCITLREGEPTHSATDYHFDPLNAGARYQSFSHEDDQRPFFDLDHAKGLDQFFSGSYSVVGGKLQLGSDHAGMSLAYEGLALKIDLQALRTRDDPRLRGEILLRSNTWNGPAETISFRELSASAMSLVIELIGNPPHTFEARCRRVRDPAFQPIALLPSADNGKVTAGPTHALEIPSTTPVAPSQASGDIAARVEKPSAAPTAAFIAPHHPFPVNAQRLTPEEQQRRVEQVRERRRQLQQPQAQLDPPQASKDSH